MDAVVTWFFGSSWEIVAGSGFAALAAVLLVAGAFSLFDRPRDDVVERLERTVGRAGFGQVRRAAGSARVALGRFVKPFAWLARPTKAVELERLRRRIVQAGLRGELSMEIFLGVKILLAATVTILVVQLIALAGVKFPLDLIVGVWSCAASFFAPNIWLGSRIRERQQQIERPLPDAMDLLVTCVEAGLGLDAALSRVAEEMALAAPLLGRELNVTFLEIQAGVPRRDAFRRLADRTGVEDLKTLSAVLTQTEIFGTSIARALRVHAEGMRVKRMQKAEERAAMVSVKMTFPLILCILPSLIAVVLGPAAAQIAATFFPGWARP